MRNRASSINGSSSTLPNCTRTASASREP
jgi:hypothetical protein